MLVVGARPQFVKAAALLARAPVGGRWLLVHTGQHYDYEMSARFFAELALPEPAYNLGVSGTNVAVQLGEMTAALGGVIADQQPAAVAVVGDTTSTLAGALAAACSRVPLAHVEAGMRSGDWAMPEERNRVLADRLARLLLCPHEGAAANLGREGITKGVEIVGDVMYEVAAAAYDRLTPTGYLAPLGLTAGRYIYATVHREENAAHPARLARIAHALKSLPLPVYLPAHPRTAAALKDAGLWEELATGNVTLAPPASYYASLALVKHAAVVITDSGGVQREAFLYGVPTITLRDRTEWPETLAAGASVLADADPGRIAAAVAAAAALPERRPRFALVGDPKPSERVAAALGRLIAAP